MGRSAPCTAPRRDKSRMVKKTTQNLISRSTSTTYTSTPIWSKGGAHKSCQVIRPTARTVKKEHQNALHPLAHFQQPHSNFRASICLTNESTNRPTDEPQTNQSQEQENATILSRTHNIRSQPTPALTPAHHTESQPRCAATTLILSFQEIMADGPPNDVSPIAARSLPTPPIPREVPPHVGSRFSSGLLTGAASSQLLVEIVLRMETRPPSELSPALLTSALNGEEAAAAAFRLVTAAASDPRMSARARDETCRRKDCPATRPLRSNASGSALSSSNTATAPRLPQDDATCRGVCSNCWLDGRERDTGRGGDGELNKLVG